jgi:tetratricopeptide (TPR) repeat protein
MLPSIRSPHFLFLKHIRAGSSIPQAARLVYTRTVGKGRPAMQHPILRASAFVFAFTIAMASQVHAGEPAWWTAQKRECGVSMPYNTWLAMGSPCGVQVPPYVPPVDPTIAQAAQANAHGVEAWNMKDWASAIAYFQQALATHPTDEYRKNLNDAYAGQHFEDGDAAFKRRDWATAEQEYKTVLLLQPDNQAAADNIRIAQSCAHWDLARTAWHERRYDDAIAEYTAANALWPNPRLDELIVKVRASKIVDEAFAELRKGHLPEAKKLFEAALVLVPDDADAQRGLARTNEVIARRRKLADAIRDILSRHPQTDGPAQHQLGETNGKGRRFDTPPNTGHTGDVPGGQAQSNFFSIDHPPTNETRDMRALRANADAARKQLAALNAQLATATDPMVRMSLKQQIANLQSVVYADQVKYADLLKDTPR